MEHNDGGSHPPPKDADDAEVVRRSEDADDAERLRRSEDADDAQGPRRSEDADGRTSERLRRSEDADDEGSSPARDGLRRSEDADDEGDGRRLGMASESARSVTLENIGPSDSAAFSTVTEVPLVPSDPAVVEDEDDDVGSLARLLRGGTAAAAASRSVSFAAGRGSRCSPDTLSGKPERHLLLAAPDSTSASRSATALGSRMGEDQDPDDHVDVASVDEGDEKDVPVIEIMGPEDHHRVGPASRTSVAPPSVRGTCTSPTTR